MSRPDLNSSPFESDPARGRRRGRAALLVIAALVPVALTALFVSALGVGGVGGSDGTDGAKTSSAKNDSARIPAAIVNDDEMVTTTAADGTETPVLAGRLLVTQLTDPDSDATAGIRWTVTNDSDAKKMLADGDVQAVLTIPKGFSKAVVSLSSGTPTVAPLKLRTDDAHSYLSGGIAGQVGDGLASALGTQLTEQYIQGLYSSVGSLGTGLQQSADGAKKIADGAGAAKSGADQFTAGLAKYTTGVSQLSTGLGKLKTGASGLSSGVGQYTGGVTQLSQALTAANAQLQANPLDPTARATVDALTGQLAQLAAGGGQLASGASQLSSGVAQSATGAAQLARGGGSLNEGATGIAGGIAQLQTGAQQLSDGLADGAAKIPASDTRQAKKSAEIAANPVKVTVSRDHEVTEASQIVATTAIPLALWMGALVLLLVGPSLGRRLLASSAPVTRVAGALLSKPLVVALVQGATVAALLHAALGVPWDRIGATLPLLLVTAVAFAALHGLLSARFGRAGGVISLVLLAVQLASTAGLWPVQVLGQPFQALSPYLPFSAAVSALQSAIAGGPTAPIAGALAVLVALAVLSLALTPLAVRARRRRAILALV
ncbi:YhgE/Pip family protein [Schumannella soli]|uniref:ABC-2 type transporter transmembrane domain-containing protein n=1 Tax=Schumannella soli TaxID=2590779 RepID=A0A506Y0Z9_9MICO|nr:YhgE/Pip family protein [Schumannella soli]TPW74069.1 hypothetical protein FJ657_15600 [Schumannella soli]